MENTKTYQIRKHILRALKQYAPAPCCWSDLMDYPGFSLIRPKPEELEQEWKNLEQMGYIRAKEGFEGEYCEITTKGLEQVNPEFKKDPFVHGARALVFALAFLALLAGSGCATYEIKDGDGRIIESGRTFGFLRTMEVDSEFENGKIKRRRISTKSSTKDIMMGVNELIDTSVDSYSKLKPGL